MIIKIKSKSKAVQKKSISSRNRWTERLSVPKTKKEAKRVMDIYGTITASATACGVAPSCFWNWLNGTRCAPVAIQKIK